MEAFSLLEVNQYIKRVLALNFDEPFWVECELNQVSHSRGNVYLELIQKADKDNEILAKNSAQIWYRKYLFIKRKIGKLIDSVLSEGIMVKLKVVVNYSERYGLSLVVEDIDPAYTFGQFEMNRQKIVEKLKQKDLLDRNAEFALPTVVQNIAVISSESAAGYQDFIQQLKENPYGYDYEIHLYQSAMQGQKTEGDVVEALRQARKAKHDVITIIRGGGAKLDLASFDNYNIAFEIAASETPVITGIGHEVDHTVTDIVAHTVLKTPTAVADFLIEHNALFEGRLISLEGEIHSEIQQVFSKLREELLMIESKVKTVPLSTVMIHKQILENITSALGNSVSQLLSREALKLSAADDRLDLLDPKNVLHRGYAIVKQGNKYVTHKKAVKRKPEELELEFIDGSLTVKQIDTHA